MTRMLRLSAAVALLVATLAAHRLAFPGSAFACVCAVDPGAPIFTGQEDAVFIGTAKELRPNGDLRFIVERWFKGGTPITWEISVFSGVELDGFGGGMTSSCSVMIDPGDRMILAARRSDQGVYVPGSCSPHATMATEDGARLLNAAVMRFGQGTSPGQAADPRDTLPDDPTLAGLAAGAIGILVLVVVIAVIGSARRRREDEPTT